MGFSVPSLKIRYPVLTYKHLIMVHVGITLEKVSALSQYIISPLVSLFERNKISNSSRLSSKSKPSSWASPVKKQGYVC